MLVQVNQGHPDRLINTRAYSGARLKTIMLVWFQPLIPAAFYFKGAPPINDFIFFQCLSQGALTHSDISWNFSKFSVIVFVLRVST